MLSRKETSHVLVRLLLRGDVKSIQQPFHTHAKNKINALRILSEIADKPFRPVPQNFGSGLLRFTLHRFALYILSFTQKVVPPRHEVLGTSKT